MHLSIRDTCSNSELALNMYPKLVLHCKEREKSYYPYISSYCDGALSSVMNQWFHIKDLMHHYFFDPINKKKKNSPKIKINKNIKMRVSEKFNTA